MIILSNLGVKPVESFVDDNVMKWEKQELNQASLLEALKQQ